MKTDNPRFLPEARREGIIVKEFENEVLIYDLDRDKAHCLNPMAGEIWRQCDGTATVSTIAASLRQKHGSEVDEKVVWLGLDSLRRSHLLKEPVDKTCWPQLLGMSRRDAVRRISLGAAIAIPIVASMTAPTAVEAAVSCGARCSLCSTSAQCCSGVCGNNGVTGCTGSGGNKCL